MTALRLCVLIPCRNEASVIERKLANLALVDWPEGAHRVIVVDDGSDDRTRELAERALRAHADRLPPATCIPNRGPAGKPGAIATGLDELGNAADLVVLTDADVIFNEGALFAVAAAFASEAQLGMACGAQRFVHALDAAGEPPRAVIGAGPAATPWDRWTAAVRRFESRRGKLFSVHGQLLAWRTELGLRPRAGVAADDLDLSITLRREHPARSIRMLSAAIFYELKPQAADDAAGQALRRARAYFQAWRDGGSAPGLQAWCYRVLPAWAPRLATVVVVAALILSALYFGALGFAVCAAILALCAMTALGRHLLRLLTVIEKARRAERREPLATRWEMQR